MNKYLEKIAAAGLRGEAAKAVTGGMNTLAKGLNSAGRGIKSLFHSAGNKQFGEYMTSNGASKEFAQRMDGAANHAERHAVGHDFVNSQNLKKGDRKAAYAKMRGGLNTLKDRQTGARLAIGGVAGAGIIGHSMGKNDNPYQ